MLRFVAVCFIPAFVVSLVATAIMRRLAPRWGLVDQPGARKVHITPTPLGGGVGIVIGFMLPLIAAQLLAWWLARQTHVPTWLPETISQHLPGVGERAGQMWMLVATGLVIAVMGLIDDWRTLPWKTRLLVQFTLAGGLTFFGGVQATLFVTQPWIGSLVTIVWMVVLINSFNFLDNMDGLSGGIGFIAAVLFAYVMLNGTSEPRWLVGGSLLVLAGSIGGFLCHNWPPASIFMGDSGSMFIGMMLAAMTVLGTFYDESASSRHVMLAPLCILAVPLYDFTSVMLIRLSEGRSPFHADKSHFSHRLVDLGLTKRNAVLTVHLATWTTGLGALLLYEVPGWRGAATVIALVLCVLAIIAILEMVGRRQSARP